jgi:hypothetical protein
MFLVSVGFVGCGPKTSGAEGITCKLDSDCGSGLACLEYAIAADGGGDAGCSSLGKICARSCGGDAGCGALDAGFVCSHTCNAAPVCQPVQM